ncbi:hypothetical protein KY495_13145 [Massilia sp. PAMC28688]|uniref:hypothetical protein n=1 Tax=Massilia sp. PAMC28688 TaxID=2861283 RepID=UPI001C625E44|nr:hypothetical protein [Massilia sp. PAMC28688]QYF91744.1 hypothetical protein KY495_13145 [Massilia sp. PAMC28688]
MNYVLKVVVPSVPPYNHDAYGFADALLRESHGAAPAPRLIQFHDALVARFPCISSGFYASAPEGAVCPWGERPLMAGFTGDIGIVHITARNVEVIPFLLRRAGALALTVIDEQANKVHRPATFCVTLDSIQKHVDHRAMISKLVPLFKRTPEEVEQLLATPKAVLRRRLDHVAAQRLAKTLDLVGCNCTVEKEMPELGVTIPISGPGFVASAAVQPQAQNDSYDSSLPGEKGVSWSPCWVVRVFDKMARKRQHY